VDATRLTGEGLLVGTAGFLAPEVIAGEPAGQAADRYALAAVAFEALVGRPPFEADGVPGMLYAHLRRAPSRPSALAPRLPRALDGPLLRGLAKDPRDRPATAAALVDGIERALAPRTGITRLLTRPLAALPRRRRRRRGLVRPVALLAAGALAVGGAAAGLTAALTRDDAPAAAATPAATPAPPALTVPGPDGSDVPAVEAGALDLPGLAAAPGAAAADVGEVRVGALPGGWDELAVAQATLESQGMSVSALHGDAGPVALLARRPFFEDVLGREPRYVLLAVSHPDGPKAVLARGLGDAPERYAEALAAAPGVALIPAP
jgi:serine/threonine-protein kinase